MLMTMYDSPYPMGHLPQAHLKVAAVNLYTVQAELGQVKGMQGQAIEAHLECLNKLIQPLALVHGPVGMRSWLAEVQYLMTAIKQRSFSGMPLMPRERQVLDWYSSQWRALRGGPCDMGLPEAQLVLIALGELAMF